MCQEDTQVVFEFGSGGVIFGKIIIIMPLDLDSNNVSQDYRGQVQMWFYLNYFQQSLICT